MANKIIRDPSIHITRSQFQEICDELGIELPIGTIFAYAQRKAINSRNILVSNQQINKQINKILLADKGDAQLIADLLYAIRIKLKHKGVRKITPGMPREWVNCKKLAEICNTFCNDFQLPIREGFIKYIEIGLGKISSYRSIPQKLISMQENITQIYEARKELDQLSVSEKSQIRNMHDYFVRCIADKTGIYENFYQDPEKLRYFVDLYILLKDKGWNYKDYILAQFEGLAWCNSIPELSTLTSDKSIARYNKYLYKNSSKEESEDEEPEESIWDRINELNND